MQANRRVNIPSSHGEIGIKRVDGEAFVLLVQRSDLPPRVRAVLDGLIDSLPPAESVVLLLSGSDPGHVDAALALAGRGGLALGQLPQGCYDPAASKALQAKGGIVATPDELATRLIEHLFA